jgi:hypothetical protein
MGQVGGAAALREYIGRISVVDSDLRAELRSLLRKDRRSQSQFRLSQAR